MGCPRNRPIDSNFKRSSGHKSSSKFATRFLKYSAIWQANRAVRKIFVTSKAAYLFNKRLIEASSNHVLDSLRSAFFSLDVRSDLLQDRTDSGICPVHSMKPIESQNASQHCHRHRIAPRRLTLGVVQFHSCSSKEYRAGSHLQTRAPVGNCTFLLWMHLQRPGHSLLREAVRAHQTWMPSTTQQHRE